ncbi:MAG TPA: CHASE domain-containing protein, partial [Roseimicrobium sp.]|nr:CHASE domain-containing protein [Roseimicrobium sp.]
MCKFLDRMPGSPFDKSTSHEEAGRKPGGVPFFSILVGIVGCSISVAVFQFTQSAEEHRIADTFNRRAENQMSVFNRTIDLYTEILYSLHTLFLSSEHVSRAEFHEATVNTLKRHGGVRALEWVPSVPSTERQKLEAETRASADPGFQFTEKNEAGQLVRAANRPLHLPILYVEPMAGNEAAFGYDLTTGPNTRMLAAARDEGIIGTSERIRLVQETSGRYGLVMAIPVYRAASLPATVEGRRTALRGYVQGVFVIEKLISETIEHTPVRGLDILIVDRSAATNNQHLGFASTMAGTDRVPTISDMLSGQHREMTARIGNREWTFLFRPNPMWLSTERTPYPGILLIGGVLFSLLLSGYLTARFRREEQVKFLVDMRTGELTAANATLEKEIEERHRTEMALRLTETSLTESQRIAKL